MNLLASVFLAFSLFLTNHFLLAQTPEDKNLSASVKAARDFTWQGIVIGMAKTELDALLQDKFATKIVTFSTKEAREEQQVRLCGVALTKIGVKGIQLQNPSTGISDVIIYLFHDKVYHVAIYYPFSGLNKLAGGAGGGRKLIEERLKQRLLRDPRITESGSHIYRFDEVNRIIGFFTTGTKTSMMLRYWDDKINLSVQGKAKAEVKLGF
jgi:hypothetical protein